MLMHSRPPIGTLFPYTTLFRSRVSEAGPGAAEEGPGGRLDAADWSRPVVGVLGGLGPAATSAFLDVLIRATVADRKSTRLNSSHVAISYAVFCLKKKNTTSIYT